MKQKIIAFIDGLILYDYILFGAVILLFILFLILAILLRRNVAISVLSVFIAFLILILGPTLGYKIMHQFLYKNEVNITKVKKLEFTDALLIEGILKNSSKMDFLTCKIKASAYKVSGNTIQDMIYPFKPFKKAYLKLDTIIKPNETKTFKLFLEPFHYSKEYNLSIGANCK
ncbi:MAG: DUF2393 family protein [Campylobacterota bacterium]|nr:DUF2393 family protein [Campylobacterota bacterium]